MKFWTILGLILCVNCAALAAEDIAGVWKTVDDETGQAKSLVQIYPYQVKFYGRFIKLFKNKEKTAVGIQGNPKILGLDIIWDMQDKGDKWKSGRILDPTKGKIYACEIWRSGNQLIVRGKIGPFGRNQIWIQDESEPVSEDFIPLIPQKK